MTRAWPAACSISTSMVVHPGAGGRIERKPQAEFNHASDPGVKRRAADYGLRFSPHLSAHAPALSLLAQIHELGFHLSEEAGRDEAVAEDTGPARDRRQATVRPLIDVVLRDDHPARRIVQP